MTRIETGRLQAKVRGAVLQPGDEGYFMMDEGQERVQASFRDNYARLAQVKARATTPGTSSA